MSVAQSQSDTSSEPATAAAVPLRNRRDSGAGIAIEAAKKRRTSSRSSEKRNEPASQSKREKREHKRERKRERREARERKRERKAERERRRERKREREAKRERKRRKLICSECSERDTIPENIPTTSQHEQVLKQPEQQKQPEQYSAASVDKASEVSSPPQPKEEPEQHKPQKQQIRDEYYPAAWIEKVSQGLLALKQEQEQRKSKPQPIKEEQFPVAWVDKVSKEFLALKQELDQDQRKQQARENQVEQRPDAIISNSFGSFTSLKDQEEEQQKPEPQKQQPRKQQEDKQSRVANNGSSTRKEQQKSFSTPLRMPRSTNRRREVSETTDPLEVALSPAVRQYLTSIHITTAAQLLLARTTDVAESLPEWRREKGMAELKGRTGALSSVSVWKKRVRQRAAAIGAHGLARVNVGTNAKLPVMEDEQKPEI